MRDIRSDLQERANFIEQQIRAAHSHFEKMVQQLQRERDVRIADLKYRGSQVLRSSQLLRSSWNLRTAA